MWENSQKDNLAELHLALGQRGSLPQTRRGLTLLSQLCRDTAVGVRNREDV